MAAKKPVGEADDSGIKDKEELTKKIEILMGPSADEAPATDNESTEQDAPSTAPEVSDEAAVQETASQPSEVAPDVPAEETELVKPVDTSETAEEPADEATDVIVDDIVAKESDELLAAEDEKLAAAFEPQKAGFGGRLRNFFANWWHNPRARKITIAGLVAITVILLGLPPTRYFLMNAAGVRVKASLTVLDDSTRQPLKNAQVRLGGQTVQTDSEGHVELERLRLGPAELVVEKRAFAPVSRQVTVGLGSNPLGEFNLTPVGSQYVIMVSDFLSGKPVASAEASSGDANARADNEGKIVLTVDPGDDQTELKVSIEADTYRREELIIDLNDKSRHALKLVPARKHAFISKRSGKYDVYKIDIDGKNEQLVLAGTGSERDDMKLVPHPTDDVVALVSTRDNARNRDNFLLSTLTLIELNDANETTKVAQSERIQPVDWLGDRLVYVQIAAGASTSSPKRHRLMTYDYKSGGTKELAASNYFNDVMAAAGHVYYAPSSAYQAGQPVQFVRVGADGSGQQTVLDKEVWNIFRTEYDKLALSVQDEWYDYHLGSARPEKAQGPPAVLRTRVYVDSPDRQRSLWVDHRDGKGVLLAYSTSDKKDKVLRSQSGLKSPVRWLTNNAVAYRIHTDQETADYAVSLDGGEPVKVRDVTNTGGVDQWYHY